VRAAEVHGQPPVDEDPEVVIAAEGEDLPLLVGEEQVHLGGEEEVLAERVAGRGDAPALLRAQREERGGVEDVDARALGRLHQRELALEGLVHARVVAGTTGRRRPGS
jgi:hypothetical protein